MASTYVRLVSVCVYASLDCAGYVVQTAEGLPDWGTPAESPVPGSGTHAWQIYVMYAQCTFSIQHFLGANRVKEIL